MICRVIGFRKVAIGKLASMSLIADANLSADALACFATVILETGNDSFRFMASAAAPKTRKEKSAT